MKKKAGRNSLETALVLNFFLVTGLCAQPLASPVVTAVGPDSRTWETGQEPIATAWGSIAALKSTKGRVVELETGMNYWDGTQWSPSDPSFEVTNGWFVTERVQHPVRISQNLNVSRAVQMTTPDGIQLESTPLAIGLYDPVSGEAAIIARITNCPGGLVTNNQIVYQNAFDGVSADVVYTLEKGSFAQDFVLTGRLNPGDWGFSTNSQIQVITEFYKCPEPDRIQRSIRVEQDPGRRARMTSPDFVDTTLGFGQLVLGQGKAYVANGTNSITEGALVAKDLVTTEGRTFLVESVAYDSVREKLSNLPQSALKAGAHNYKKVSAKKAYAAMQVPQKAFSANSPIEQKAQDLAQTKLTKRPGLVIDYNATLGGTLSDSYVFARNTTYYINGTVNRNGAVTFEGGAVLKYAQGASVALNSAANCNSGEYSPVICTSVDDDTVGGTCRGLPGYSTNADLSLRYAKPAIQLNYLAAPSINNMRFLYCQNAINVMGIGNVNGFPFALSDSQFVNCSIGVSITDNGCGSGSGGPSAGVVANNVLLGNVRYAVSCEGAAINSQSFDFTHCTVNRAHALSLSNTRAQLNFTNSILANVTNLYDGGVSTFGGINNGFYNSTPFGSGVVPSSASPFVSEPVGAGSYYLADGSVFRDAGVSEIDSNALISISKKTTFAPLLLTNTVDQDVLLLPQARRDADIPDLGYHYDPIDYLAEGFTIARATLSISNGTTIACTWSDGIWLADGARIVCVGKPNALNRFVDYSAVQEQPIVLTNSGIGSMINCYRPGGIGMPAQFKFTEFRRMTGGEYPNGRNTLYADDKAGCLFSDLTVSDCLFLGNGDAGYFNAGVQSLAYKNNLLEGGRSRLGTEGNISFYNNLVRNCEVAFGTNVGCVVRNNAFDSSIVSAMGGRTTHDHNAYINTLSTDLQVGSSDILLTNFAYRSGPFGKYYQASTNLVDKGSCKAPDLGFYQYTTQWNPAVKEGMSILDIGLHYVANDETGNPDKFDTDLGGAAGFNVKTYSTLADSSKLGGQSSSSRSLRNGLQVFTPLK